MTNYTPCGDCCSPGMCAPTNGEHIFAVLAATRGGPMDDANSDRFVDVAPSVHLVGAEAESGTVAVQLQAQAWLRGGSAWGVPGELFDLLPAVDMSATRARHLAELLVRAADEADRINDGPLGGEPVIDRLGGPR